MSLVGMHYAHAAKHPGFKGYLKQTANAGSPFAGIFSLGQNVMPDILEVSPKTIGVFRIQIPIGDTVADDSVLGQGDPVQKGREWYLSAEEYFKKNPGFAFYSCTNELNPKNPEHHRWANLYWLSQMKTADEFGRKLVWGNFSGGNPDHEDWLLYYTDCIRYSVEHGHALGTHEYGLGAPAVFAPDGSLIAAGGTLRAGSYVENTLRYRRTYEILTSAGLGCPQLIFSECSPGNYIGGGPIVDLADVEWYDAQLMADREKGIPILFAAMYQWGGDEAKPFEQIVSGLTTYVASHPTPDPVPPEPEPGDQMSTIITLSPAVPIIRITQKEGTPILYIPVGINCVVTKPDFVAVENLVPQDITHSEYEQVRKATVGSKQDILYSADNAKRLVSQAAPGSKVVVWEPSRWPDGNILEYLSVATEIRHFAKQSLLNVAYLNQLDGTDADYAPGDCGPANLAMILNFYGKTVTVDQVSQATGLGAGFSFASWTNLDTAAKTFGYRVSKNINRGFDDVRSAIDAKRPLIALINYAKLPVKNKYDANYIHAHFLTVIGYDDEGVVINDSYWHGTDGANLRLTWSEFDLAWSTINADFTYPRQLGDVVPFTPPIPTPTKCYFGIGHGTQNEIPMSHSNVYAMAFGKDDRAAFLFLTMPDGMDTSIARIKAKNPSAFLMARIFFSVGDSPFTPQDFVNFSESGMKTAYSSGIRDFQVHNEPNLSSEGLGLGWKDGREFGNWLKDVICILKRDYPEARFWMPALSPNDDAPQFFADMVSTGVGSLVHGYCFHNYWTIESGGQFNMVDETGGLSHKKLHRLLSVTEQLKQVSITEFSNNRPLSPRKKGEQYARYRTLLNENGVHSAFSFVLNWSPDSNQENWVSAKGGSTGIAEGFKS